MKQRLFLILLIVFMLTACKEDNGGIHSTGKDNSIRLVEPGSDSDWDTWGE